MIRVIVPYGDLIAAVNKQGGAIIGIGVLVDRSDKE